MVVIFLGGVVGISITLGSRVGSSFEFVECVCGGSGSSANSRRVGSGLADVLRWRDFCGVGVEFGCGSVLGRLLLGAGGGGGGARSGDEVEGDVDGWCGSCGGFDCVDLVVSGESGVVCEAWGAIWQSV